MKTILSLALVMALTVSAQAQQCPDGSCPMPQRPPVKSYCFEWNDAALKTSGMDRTAAGKLRGNLVAVALGGLVERVNMNTDSHLKDTARKAVAFADETLLAMGLYRIVEVRNK